MSENRGLIEAFNSSVLISPKKMNEELREGEYNYFEVICTWNLKTKNLISKKKNREQSGLLNCLQGGLEEITEY